MRAPVWTVGGRTTTSALTRTSSMPEKEPFWRVAAEETEPCVHLHATQIIDAYYNIPPDRREGTFDQQQFEDLLRSHVIGEHCNACWWRLQQKKNEELLRWHDPGASHRSS